ncbi:MAG: ATP-binding protein [Candidatus Obscuribacterales bacterium]|nr:ATP-binding protein [Candidatus Obscuribacterales bacterium]
MPSKKSKQNKAPAPQAEPTKILNYEQPAFLDALNEAYQLEGKNVVTINDNTRDLYWSKNAQRFHDLEQTLYHHLKDAFTMVRLDAGGIETYTSDKKDLDTLATSCKAAEQMDQSIKLGDLKAAIKTAYFSPLEAIELLAQMLQAVTLVRMSQKQKSAQEDKPVCVVVQLADAIFPRGSFGQVDQLDRQRLVRFLNLIESQWFKDSAHLIILISESSQEISSQIVGLPSVRPISIGYPSDAERAKFITTFCSPANEDASKISYERGYDAFVSDSAGLTLTALEALLKTASRNEPHIVTRKALIEHVNRVIKAQLGDTVSIELPDHGPEDIIGYEANKQLLARTFERSENPKTAASVIIASGPNGAGKSYQFEAFAKSSGRVIIRLAQMRGKYFGETEAALEKLRMLLHTVGKSLVLIDEADTQVSDARGENVHEVEKRMSGTLMQMTSKADGRTLYVLITSRADKLAPDIKSRAAVQVPVFDLQGDERKHFVQELFKRAGVTLTDEEWNDIAKKTANYGARDFANLVKEMVSRGHKSPSQTLTEWVAPGLSIKKERRLQTLIAALHCSELALLPEEFRSKIENDEIDDIEAEIEKLKLATKR